MIFFKELLRIALAAVSAALLTACQTPSAMSAKEFPVVEATVADIRSALISGQVTCVQLVQRYLDRIAAYDQIGPSLNGVQNVNPRALQDAADLDAKVRISGPVGPLHCIPVMVKDQIETDWMPTTYGSALFKTFNSGRTADSVERLRAAGAIILAKNNLGEFAALGSGSAFGDCRNAYDPKYYASGSSCGTGVAITASLGAVGLGEDTAGSLRGPASHGNLVGLRPTMGLVSRHGVMPQAPTRDTLGPITRTVADAAAVLDAIAGYDPKDPVTAVGVGHQPSSYTQYLDPNGLKGMRFGIIREPLSRDADVSAPDYKAVQGMVTRAAGVMRSRGAEVVDPVVIEGLFDLVQKSDSDAETADATDAYLAQFSNAPVKTFKEIVASPVVLPLRRQMMAKIADLKIDSPEFHKALATREQLRIAVLKAMADNRLDGLIYAPFDHVPPPLPKATKGSNRLMSTFLGYPSIVLPAGFSEAGIPVGIEIMARPFQEGLLIKAGHDYERSAKLRRAPSLTPEILEK